MPIPAYIIERPTAEKLQKYMDMLQANHAFFQHLLDTGEAYDKFKTVGKLRDIESKIHKLKALKNDLCH